MKQLTNMTCLVRLAKLYFCLDQIQNVVFVRRPVLSHGVVLREFRLEKNSNISLHVFCGLHAHTPSRAYLAKLKQFNHHLLGKKESQN